MTKNKNKETKTTSLTDVPRDAILLYSPAKQLCEETLAFSWSATAFCGRTTDFKVLGIKAFFFYRLVDRFHVEARLGDPIVIHHLAHVVPGRVGKKYSNALVFPDIVLLDKAEGTGHARSTTAPNQQALMTDDSAEHGERLIIVSLNPIIGDTPIKHGGDEIITDTLNLISGQSLLPRAGGTVVHAVRNCQDAAPM